MTLLRRGGMGLALCLLCLDSSGYGTQVPRLVSSVLRQDPGPDSLRDELRSCPPAQAFRKARRLYLDQQLGDLLLALPDRGWSSGHPVARGLAAGGLEIARDLIPYLGDKNAKRRNASLQLLLELEADEALVQALHAPDPLLRATARLGLKRMGSACLPRLIEELRVGNQDYREEALASLESMGTMAARALGILLLDEDFFDRVSVILINHGRPGFETILDRWARLSPAARQSILHQMGSRKERSRALLLGIVRFGTNAQALCAVDLFWLQQDARSLVEALRLARTTVKTHALTKLIDLGKPAIPDIARALQDGNPDVRRLALKSLQDLGPPAYPTLAGLLERGDPSLRLEAVLFLIQAGNDGLDALGRVQKRAQGRNLSLLHASLRKRRAALIPRLRDGLQSKQVTTRGLSLGLLAELHAWADLVSALGHEDAALRAAVEETLVAGGKACIPAILDELAEGAKGSQAPCIVILDALGDEAIPALIMSLDHRTRGKAAALALRRLTQPSGPGR